MTDQELDLRLLAIPVPEPNLEWSNRVKKQLNHNPWKRRLAFASLAACAALGAALQNNDLGHVTVTNANQVTIKLSLRGQSTFAGIRRFQIDSSVVPSDNWAVRTFFDRSAGTVFGYEVRAVPVSKDRARLEFQPLHQDPRTGHARDLRWVAPVSLPLPKEVSRQEPVRVELAREGDAVLFEDLTLEDSPEPFPVSMRRHPLRLIDPVLLMDGIRVVDPSKGMGLAGASLVVYWPGEKQINLRLDNPPENTHGVVGWVEGSVLEFELDGHRYRIESAEPITDGPRQLIWGRTKQDNEPKGPIFFGSAG